LAIDLSSARGVIAVMRGGEVIFDAAFQSERSHNAQVFAPLTEALAVIGDDKAVIAIGTGPGSYTGVRISIAAAHGIALSRDWSVVGWPSIATVDLPIYHVLGDARRGQFYTAQIADGRLVAGAEVMTAEAAKAQMANGGIWLSLDAKSPLGIEQVMLHQPSAINLGQLIGKLSEAELETLSSASLEPIYLQEAFITVTKKAGKQVPAAANAYVDDSKA
ncbi:MAG: tRNA (adenosine(37)-N6)-threonylcarbamoyltransferase complex dimerization subunit type 1 TsaB, partial [Prosthecobacter sp.]